MTGSDRSEATPNTPAAAPKRARRSRQRRAATGSVRQLASGRWQARSTDGSGARRAAPHTFATRRAAEDWLAACRTDVLRGDWRAPELGAMPLADYAADYLATRVDLAVSTRAMYGRLLTGWILAELPHPNGRRMVSLGQLHLRDLDTATVRAWHAAALAEAQRRAATRAASRDRRRRTRARHAAREWALAQGLPVARTGRLSPAVIEQWTASGAPASATLTMLPTQPDPAAGRVQVAQAYQVLRSILGTAHRDGLIVANPCTVPGAGRVKARERVPATADEVARIAARMPARYAAAVHVAAWSGLRAGELFGLTRAHVDPQRGTLRVERALVNVPGQPLRFGAPKTTASLRTVHLPAPVAALLAEHLGSFAAPGPDALVFARPDGKPVSSTERTRMFRDACAGLGLHELRWHDLRHTGATLAAQAGASLRELQARLGHSTVTAAMTYQHATTERDRELAQRLAELVVTGDPDAPQPAAGRPLRIVQ